MKKGRIKKGTPKMPLVGTIRWGIDDGRYQYEEVMTEHGWLNTGRRRAVGGSLRDGSWPTWNASGRRVC